MSQNALFPLFTAAQVRQLDRLAIKAEGAGGYALMCRAGEALAQRVQTHWPENTPVCVICGPGNNGGDGYVLARLLRSADRQVHVRYLTPPQALGGAARRAAADWQACGGRAQEFDGELPESAGLLVDAMLGTGLDRAPEGAFAQAVEAINRHPAPVLAVDIPSGLMADSGVAPGASVHAARTLTFIGRKQGLYTADGRNQAGVVEYDSLAVSPQILSRVPAQARLVSEPVRPLLPVRMRAAHKGHFGHVLVVGGAPGTGGAARLAAEAAARCGAGLVSVATAAAHAATLNYGCAELMVHAVARGADLDALLARATVVVVGPGLGRTDWSRQLLERVLDSALPLVVDADALNLLADDPLSRGNWILTPHPGEAGRLLKSGAVDVNRNRFDSVRTLQARFGGVAILKGAGTLICSGDGAVSVCEPGNPGMASGGMGDVLSGVLGGLLAQGLAAGQAATTGTWVHARAADLEAACAGERGLLAHDLIPLMRRLLNE